MPIRRRNELWQADVITSDGRRERKSFTSKSAAQAFIAERKPNVKPRPRSRSRKASPESSHRTQSAGLNSVKERSAVRSSVKSAHSTTGKSLPPTSAKSAIVGARQSRARASHIKQHSVSGSGSSEPHGQSPTESRTSQQENPRRELSQGQSLKRSSRSQTQR